MPAEQRQVPELARDLDGAASAVRTWKNALPLACWIAWPTSCAATAIDATELDWATACDRCTDLSRGS